MSIVVPSFACGAKRQQRQRDLEKTVNPEEFGRVEVKLHKHIAWVIFTSCTDI